MPDPSHANHLIHETSPYLRQHAHNPVDWHPWNAEALARAVQEDRPILLSIGYSACHWCHVMERESFEDPETAALMNALFVNIKVDREERPDLDRIYQLAHQILTQRSGGWPLTVFITPREHMPFFAGTYFPPEPRHGLPAFRDLLNLIARFYRERGDDIRAQNGELREVLASLMSDPGPAMLDETPLLAWQQALPRWSDRDEGGFGNGAKFPHTPALRLLLHRLPEIVDPAEQAVATDFLRQSLDAMALRGLWDHVGGGFFRYTVDPAWRIPHFEKMLYDNALLLELYSEAWTILAEPLYRERALDTARWAIREMQAPQGGFYASLDADSGDEEGAYYLWSRAAIRASLPEPLWTPCCAAWGLDEAPNFDGRHWHLQLQAPIPELAHRLRITPEQLQAQLHAARDLLREVRAHRPPVLRDEKVLTAWNGLMIKALAVAARRLARRSWARSPQRLSTPYEGMHGGTGVCSRCRRQDRPICRPIWTIMPSCWMQSWLSVKHAASPRICAGPSTWQTHCSPISRIKSGVASTLRRTITSLSSTAPNPLPTKPRRPATRWRPAPSIGWD